MMLVSLVLGIFSFRETLGKVTTVCSILVLLVYGAFIAFMSRGPGTIQSQEEQAETRYSEPQPIPVENSSRLNKQVLAIMLTEASDSETFGYPKI